MVLSDKEKYLKNVIKEWHFKSPNKVIKHLKGNELGITSKDVYQFFDKYHLKKSIKKFDKSLMGNKFSSIKDAYQMDIYFIGKEYIYLLLININTKYAWCKRMPNKKAESVVEALKDFVPQYHPKIIESDEDSAFLDIKTMNYLQSENIILKTTPRKYKDYLSVIDRLCTTLNKYVYEGTGLNVEASKDESEDEDMFKIDDDAEYADEFEVPSDYDENEAINTDVESFIDKYNKTYNYAIKMTPEQMQKDENEQLKWVYHQLKIRDAKDKMNLSRNLKVGDKVRYILDRDRGKKKHAKGIKKHQFSKYYYIINRVITPYLYEIIAKDGTVKAVPRYRLYKLNYIGDVKWSKSIYNEGLEEDALGKPIYFIDKILEYEYTDKDTKSSPQIKNCFYTVRKVQIRDKQRPLIVKEKMSVYQFRQRFNIITSLNKLEMEFLDNHPDDWKYDSKKKLIVPK